MKNCLLPSRKLSFSSAFTLTEVLVVIAIIVALAALAFLGTSRMQSAADRALSVDNLRKLQLSNGVYASDNGGRFVATFTRDSNGKTGGLWDRNPEFLDIYLGQLDQKDSGKSQESRVTPKHLDPIAYKAKANGYKTLKASYGMVSKENYSSGDKNVNSAYRMSELTSAPQTAAFVTAVNWLVLYSGRKGWDGVEGKINAPRIAYRYNNKALVVYYDGHVGEITQADMEELDSRGGRNNIFWKGNGGTP